MQNFWGDATNVTGMVIDFNPYFGKAKGSYPPLAYLLFCPLAAVSTEPKVLYSVSDLGTQYYYLYYLQPLWTMLFVIFLISILVLFFTVYVKQLRIKGYSFLDAIMTGFAICISYPMLYTIERGNILLIAVLAVSIFIFYYDSNCTWKKEITLISLAIAAGIKISPAIFGILLICKKDWNAVFRTICYGLLFFIIPFFFFSGGIDNVQQMFLNIKYFLKVYAGDISYIGTGFITTYVKFAKILFADNYYSKIVEFSQLIIAIINILTSLISVTLFLGVFHFKEQWKKVMNITLVLLILPQVSHLYCVLYLAPFTLMFLVSLYNSDKISIDKTLVFIALLMIYFVYRCPISNFFNLNVAIPMLTIIGLFYSLQEFMKSKHILPVDLIK